MSRSTENNGYRKFKRVNSIEELIKTEYSVLMYAMIAGRRNTYVKLINVGGRIYISVNNFSSTKLTSVLRCLSDLANDLSKHGIKIEEERGMKVY